jgi:hypothetical protein
LFSPTGKSGRAGGREGLSRQRRIALLALGAAVLAASAWAQTRIRIEKIEQVGDWDKVTSTAGTLFASAWPNLRPARAYCLSGYLNVPYDEIPGFGANGAAAEKIGASRDYACLLLTCNPGRFDPEQVAYRAILMANAAPLAARNKVGNGVSLRVRYEPGEPLLTLFDRTSAGESAFDGNLRLFTWSVSDRLGAGRDHVRVEVSFSASRAFLEQLAYRQRTEFRLLPGKDREIPAFAHAGRPITLSLASMDAPLTELEPICARTRGN